MSGHRGEAVKIDMFPFLSVLCSIIGVMVLLIVLVISSRAFELTQPPAAPPTPVFLPEPERKPPGPAGITDEQYTRFRAQIDQLTAELGERHRELSTLSRKIQQLEELLTAKEDETLTVDHGGDLVIGTDLEPPTDVEFVEDEGFRVTQKPRFIEVQADEFILHPERRTFRVAELQQEKSPLRQFLQAVDKNRQQEYLLFLIHPNGAAAYQEIFTHLVENYGSDKEDEITRIGTGKEPFTPGWLLISQAYANSGRKE